MSIEVESRVLHAQDGTQSVRALEIVRYTDLGTRMECIEIPMKDASAFLRKIEGAIKAAMPEPVGTPIPNDAETAAILGNAPKKGSAK